jgi:rhodanese-related sulfurtransferase
MSATTEFLQDFKEQLFEQFGKLGRALSSPRRLELLDLLCQAERSVEDLCKETGLSPSNVSQHLRVLKEAHLLESRQEGLNHVYRLSNEEVSDFWQRFRHLAMSQLPEVREILRSYLHDGAELERISPKELKTRMTRGDVVVLDLRSEPEYRSGHLPGARSIPLVDLIRRLDEIPRDREVVAYCRGPYCIMAQEAVRLLRENGYEARRMEEGLIEWRAHGFAVESG